MWERGDLAAPATVLQQPELHTHREVQNQTPLLQRLEVTAYGSCKPEPNCTWVAACLPAWEDMAPQGPGDRDAAYC